MTREALTEAPPRVWVAPTKHELIRFQWDKPLDSTTNRLRSTQPYSPIVQHSSIHTEDQDAFNLLVKQARLLHDSRYHPVPRVRIMLLCVGVCRLFFFFLFFFFSCVVLSEKAWKNVKSFSPRRCTPSSIVWTRAQRQALLNLNKGVGKLS